MAEKKLTPRCEVCEKPARRRFCSLECYSLNARTTAPARFLKKLHHDSSGCHLWTGNKSRTGYGLFKLNGKTVSAHRYAWVLSNGPIPEGMSVCHSCDTRSCCNVSHLFIGTHAENMADMVAKHRGVNLRGSDHGSSKLSEEDILKIRASNRRQIDIAAELGISQTHVSDIQCRKTWKHLE